MIGQLLDKKESGGERGEMGSGKGPRGGTQTRDAWGYVLTKYALPVSERC